MIVRVITRPVLSLAAAAVILASHVTSVSAQSLADVARREAERRQQVTSGKVYTDGDLAHVEPATPPAPQTTIAEPPASAETTPATSQATPETPGGTESTLFKGREKRDEQYWRNLLRDLRKRVAQANADAAAQEARLAEIDSGAQTPAAARDRDIVAATLTRSQRSARSWNEELTRSLKRAQTAKVPDEWLR